MIINRIAVEKLFGIYDYNLPLFSNDNVSIIHAPNGMGKTTLLRLIDAVINYDLQYLDDVPFSRIELFTDRGTSVGVEKKDINDSLLSGEDSRGLINFMAHSRKSSLDFPFIYFYFNKKKNIQRYRVSLDSSIVMELRRFYAYTNRYYDGIGDMPSSELGKMPNIADYYMDSGIKNILEPFKTQSTIHYIEANRVFRLPKKAAGNIRSKVLRSRLSDSELERIVECSSLLKDKFSQYRALKETKSDSLDRTFPKRVIDVYLHRRGIRNKIITEQSIKERLQTLSEKRKELQAIGLLADTEETVIGIEDIIPEETLDMLDVYIEDNMEKLSIYDEFKRQLEIFMDIINERNGFSNKQMVIDGENGITFISLDGQVTPLQKLSSGEKVFLI